MIRAAVMYDYNQPLKVEELEVKEPRPDEVVVKIAAAGVCHSDLSMLQGKIPIPPPSVLGHEGAGVVEAVGRDVHDLQPGDHVVLSWVENCGKCPYCVAGTEHLCEANIQSMLTGGEGVFQRNGTVINRTAGVGCFAEKTVVKATAAIRIPKDVPLDRACLVGCGVMTGVGAAINTAHVAPGQTVAVFGCGGVGLNVIQGAALAGASTIIGVDLVASKLELARQFGATDVVDAAKTPDVPGAIREKTGGLGVDYAFEVIGAPPVIARAFASLKRGGKVVVVGVVPMGVDVSLPGFSFALEEKSVIGSLYGSARVHRDMPRMIELYMRKKLKLDELVSRRISLEQVNEAFEAMEKGEVARSVIVFD